MSKISVIGAGNVGASCVEAVQHMDVASEVTLLDIKPGLAEGKALDMNQGAKLYHAHAKVVGATNDYVATENSDVVIITSGMPRKPGMSRDDLVGVNAKIMTSIVDNILKYSPEAKIIVVANPMDTMTYLVHKTTDLPKNRILGMGGMLDSSRFTYYLSEAMGVPVADIECMVIGAHGDKTMIPLIRLATYKGIPVTNYLSKEVCDKVIADTMVGGATLTAMLGTSAWYAPGISAASMAKAIIKDEKKLMPCSCYLEGEYGESDICMGVPAVLGKNGVEKIFNVELNEEEKALFKSSAEHSRATNAILTTLGYVK